AAVRAFVSGCCGRQRIVLLWLVLWGTVGCSQPAVPRWLGGPSPTPTATPVRVTTELSFWHWLGTPAEMAYQQQLLTAFQQQNPTVTVTLHTPDDYARRLRTAMGTDRPPDIIALNLFQLPDLVAAGALAPLSTALLTDPDRYPHLRAAMQVDGTPYCLPLSFYTLGLFYNKQLFDNVGLAYPTDAWQWEDLQAAAEALTDSENGQFGLVLSADFSRWLAFLYQAGGTVTTADGRAMAINSPEATIALDFYSNLVLEGKAAPPASLDSRWPGEAFAMARAAMTIEGNWLVPYLATEAPDLAYGTAPLPAGPAGTATLSFATCLAVTAASPNQRAAEELLAYLGSPEAMAGWLPITNALPALRSVEVAWRTTYTDQSIFADQVTAAREWQLPAGFQPWLADRNDELRRIFGGFIPANALLPAAENEGNELLQP
ncbi:MAG: sugar ABC transporter substrate-binding protein, partial [Caldilineaceae bacterium]|nr:sugar ABC transporter substrate-binding protein [Caldilineaceae bacterium]